MKIFDRAGPCKGSALPTELIAPRPVDGDFPLGGQRFSGNGAASTGTQGREKARGVPLKSPRVCSGVVPRCTDTDHRCNALGLAFFALMHTGDLDDLTRAALAQCREGAV